VEGPEGQEEMKTQLRKIVADRNGGDYESALEGCNAILESNPDDADALGLRATVYMLMKDYQQALADHVAVTSSPSPKVKDFFLAAETAYLLRDYVLACDFLRRCIDIARERNDDYFDSASYLLLAFGLFKQGKYSEARSAAGIAKEKDPEASYPIPGENRFVDVSGLLAEIAQASRGHA
jgi:tetratricopeptide (TPR) repeat protein